MAQNDRIENQLKELSGDLRNFVKEVHDALMSQTNNINQMIAIQKDLVNAVYSEKDKDRRNGNGKPNAISVALVITVVTLLASNFYLVIQGVDRKASGIDARATNRIKEVDQRLALHWSQPMHSKALEKFGNHDARISTLEEREKNNQRATDATMEGIQKQVDSMEKNQRETRQWMYGKRPDWESN